MTALFLFAGRGRPGLGRLRLRYVLAAGTGAQNHVHLVALLPRRRFGDREIPEVGYQSLQDPAPDLRVRQFAAAEEDRRLDLVAVQEEALDVLLLEVVVVLVVLGPELDLLDLDDALVLLGLARTLLLLVLVLAKVHDPADRWHRCRGDLDQVESLLTGDGYGLRRRHDPELRAGLVDYADFTDPDALVGADAVVTSGRAIESYNFLLYDSQRARDDGLAPRPFLRVPVWQRLRACLEALTRSASRPPAPVRADPS